LFSSASGFYSGAAYLNATAKSEERRAQLHFFGTTLLLEAEMAFILRAGVLAQLLSIALSLLPQFRDPAVCSSTETRMQTHG
jgi:hypothetical protein